MAEYETIDIEGCVDCVMLIANADTECYVGNVEEYLADIERNWPEPWELVYNCPEECEGSFSWSPCGVCGSHLGGDRHPVAAMKRIEE